MATQSFTGKAPYKGITRDWIVNLVVSSTFTLIGCIAILFRILALILRRRPIGYDDYAMFLAFASNIGYAVASWISVRWGVGLRLEDVPPDWPIKAIRAVYVVEVFYYFTIFFIKMSLTFLYLRIASGLGNGFYKGTIGMMVILTAQLVSTIVVEAIQCIPMARYWDPSVPGHCISITGLFYSTAIFTIVTDIIILSLPLSTLWKINRPRAQRNALLVAFLVGGISTIASCIRLYSVGMYTESHDPLRDAAPINTWSFIEINLGILCASAPAIKPLFMYQTSEPKTPQLPPPATSFHSYHDDSSDSGYVTRNRRRSTGKEMDLATFLRSSTPPPRADSDPFVEPATLHSAAWSSTLNHSQSETKEYELQTRPSRQAEPALDTQHTFGPAHHLYFSNAARVSDPEIDRNLNDREILVTKSFVYDGNASHRDWPPAGIR